MSKTWTALLVPRLDLLGPGSRITVAAREGSFPNALASYRKEPDLWVDVALLRLRDHADQVKGHYWQPVWSNPVLKGQIEELEWMMGGCQHEFKVEPVDPLTQSENGNIEELKLS